MAWKEISAFLVIHIYSAARVDHSVLSFVKMGMNDGSFTL